MNMNGDCQSKTVLFYEKSVLLQNNADAFKLQTLCDIVYNKFFARFAVFFGILRLCFGIQKELFIMNKNILDFGAIADGIALNTEAIQNAIDVCAESGGGRVDVPAGVYKTGTIWLRDNVELHLELGAELLASENMDDYNELEAYEQNFGSVHEEWVGKHLIIAHEIKNCAITGFGTINGNCQAFVVESESPKEKFYGWCHGISQIKDKTRQRPGQLICFVESKNIKVNDVTIINSPCWSCFVHGCEYVQVRGIKINNPIWMKNSDGIDVDSSRFVTISDCIIQTGDDAITLRADEKRLKNKDMHCEYVSITNCILSTGICAFRIGVGNGVIRHARISNITIFGCLNIVQLCTAYNNNGKVDIEDVNFSNISAQNTDRCIQAFALNNAKVKNITMENIRTTGTVMSYIECVEGEIKNVNLRNIEIYYSDKSTELPESELKFRGNHLLFFRGCSELKLEGLILKGSLYGALESVKVVDCDGLIKKDCNF